MACRLLGAKPLSKPVITSHESHPKEQNGRTSYWNEPIFIDDIALKVIVCNSGDQFEKWAHKPNIVNPSSAYVKKQITQSSHGDQPIFTTFHI